MMINSILNNLKRIALFCCVTFIPACGSQDQAPKPGEYGQILFQQAVLSTEEIQQLLTESQSDTNALNTKNFAVDYTATSSQNPYRAVLLVKGRAMTSDEVSVKFQIDNYNAAIQQTSSNLMQMDAGVDQIERLETLDAGQDFNFVMDGAPFSVNAANDPNSMTSQLSLLESRNVEFQSIELQIWQGKGSQYGVMRYLWFIGLVLLIVWVYRVIVEKKADQVEDFLNRRKRK